jgi:membrane protein implicated in regulation of membrane protease activity
VVDAVRFLVFAAVVVLLLWLARHYYWQWLGTQSGHRSDDR